MPDEVTSLQELVRELTTQLTESEKQNGYLREQLNLLLAKRYGSSSEKHPSPQRELFNEAEAEANLAEKEESALQEECADSTKVSSHTRKKRGRKPLPDYLPRIRIEHDLSTDEKQCPCGCGEMVCIGEESSEQLDIIPAKVQVLQHVRFKYACKVCEEGVKTSLLPPQPIPKSNASPGLLAHIAVAKYQDALPLHRQEAILSRAGIALGRHTLAGWMIRCGMLIDPLINLLRDQLDDYDIRQMDETPVQVLDEAGRSSTSQSYMWLQRGGPPKQPVILFDYDPSRGRAVPERLLAAANGWLVSDGYEVYNNLPNELIRVGCWAHARRKFDEAVKAQGKGKKSKSGRAHQGLAYIQALYRIEREAKNTKMSPEERGQLRQQQAKPILEELKTWLDKSLPHAPPKSAIGKALHYLHNQWAYLMRYLEDGRLPIDNNAAERAIRPFVIGRKNWLFSATPKGAQASAKLYSLIETAKANGHEPFAYLRHVFKQLPMATTVEAIERLLPWNTTPEQISAASVQAVGGVN